MLKKLWAQGKSARQIAAKLGSITTKAVFAQVRRLGLPGRSRTPAIASDLPEALREYLRAFESGDASTLARWIAVDVDHLQIGDDGYPTTEKAMIFRIEVYEAGAYADEANVWSVKFMLSGVWQLTILQGFQAGQAVRLPGHIMAKVVDGKIVRLRESM